MKALIVGCGCPNRSMGWYHAQNILDGKIVGADGIVAVVEPFYGPSFRGHEDLRGEGLKPGQEQFEEFALKHSLRVYSGIDGRQIRKDLEACDEDLNFEKDVFAVIALRTCDVKESFMKLLELGVKKIYLEKPGGTNRKDLVEMRLEAEKKQCAVTVG